MTTPRTTPSRRDHLTLKERVDLAEGEYSLSESEDDLDILPKGSNKRHFPEVSFDEYPNNPGDSHDAIDISSDGGEGMSSDDKDKKKPLPKGERVAFDENEDSDATYQQFKKRKSVQRKKYAAERVQVKKRMNQNSMVGKKSRPPTRKPKERHFGEEFDDEMALMKNALPDYLQKRQTEWQCKREKLQERCLKVPPFYDDIYFSDDERIEYVKERPAISENVKPTGRYKDIELPFSLGLIPAPIAQFLRGYQVDGVRFMHEKFVYQQGGILGDDMGLGKTIQVIAFLTAAFGKTADERDAKRMRKMRRKSGDRWYPRVLLVVPGSLMANWKNELDKWGWWHTEIYHGGMKQRGEAISTAQSGRLEIMITTYDTYRRNASEVNGVRWDVVVADECHKIKEKTSAITKEMNDVNALCRIGLTGTAIQNKYEELWTLLNWTNPSQFGSMSTWKTTICVPLKLGQSHDATMEQIARARNTAQKLANNLLPRFLMRRTKSLIADQLPKKSDKVIFCPLTETQTEAYNNFGDCEIVRYIRDSADSCTCGSGKKQGWCCYTEVDGIPWQHFVFPALTWYQKIANHVALLLPGTDIGEKHEKELEKLRMAMPGQWKPLYRRRDSIMNFANQEFCGKWRILKRLLKLWHSNGDKVLVFSYSVRLLRMLDMLFKTTSYNVSYLDGSIPLTKRQEIVDDYNSNPSQFVFLISTKAGGLGLNITSANKVVVVDPNWNPAYDLQAQDRAYRIGQTRDVEVFRLVSAGTMEEIVYARQVYKQQQANIGYNASVERRYFKGVQDQKELKGEIFGLKNLFAPASDNVKLRDIFNKTNIAESKAGVEIAGLDLKVSSDDDDDDGDQLYEEKEDAWMSEMAEEILDGPAARRRKATESAKRIDPVQAVLANMGVKYTHENDQVIGTSRIETKISSRAQKAGNDLDWNRERAFAQSQASQKNGSVGHDGDDDDYGDDGTGSIKYRYKPDEDVRKRQFCEMARTFGYEVVSEFALVVEGWTQEDRRRCLEGFYAERRKALVKQ